MVEARTLTIINISLGFLSLLLIVSLFGLTLPNVGYGIFNALDAGEEHCFLEVGEESQELSLAQCCQHVRQQLSCEQKTNNIQEVNTNVLCKTGDSENTPEYYLTNKAYRSCAQSQKW